MKRNRSFLFLIVILILVFGYGGQAKGFSPVFDVKVAVKEIDLVADPEIQASSIPETLQNMATVPICGTIANSTWTTGNTYYINACDVIVPVGVTLSIQPGVTVKFKDNNSALIVNGSLLAESGSALTPINFTSYLDDTRGGEIDGVPGTVGSPGDWYGLHFSAGSVERLRNVFIGYAGANVFDSYVGWNKGQLRVIGADVQMRDSRVSFGKAHGIYLEGIGFAGVFDNVQSNNNKSTDSFHPAYPFYQYTVNMAPQYHNLSFSGNDVDAVGIVANDPMPTNLTIGGAPVFMFLCSYTGCDFTIDSGKTLTISPGTTLRMYSVWALVVKNGGTLIAEGTVTEPIIFTSDKAVPVAGGWRQIIFEENSTAQMSYCDVGYTLNAALDIWSSNVHISHCLIHDSASDGVSIRGTDVSPVFEDVSVTHNAHYGVLLGDKGASSGGKTLWDGGSISNNNNTGIYLVHWAAGMKPVFKNLTISNNNGDGVFIDYSNQQPLLENLTLTGNIGAAVNQSADSSPVFHNLSMTGNGKDAVVIPGGTLQGARYWGSGQPDLTYLVQGNIIVPTGAFLSLEPGITLRFASGTYLYMQTNGALYALGTPDHIIKFTGQVETPGYWRGIEIGSTSRAVMQNCDIGFSGSSYNSSNLYIWSIGFTVIQNCIIHDSAYFGITSTTTTPILSNNQITNNSIFGVRAAYGGIIDARHNWWGDASGPYHATLNPTGKGDKINDANVLFDPWLTSIPTTSTLAGQMVVDTGGPRLVSPGQTTDFAIQYINLTTTTVEDTVLMLQLPAASEYIDNSGGGTHWPERQQVFWKLGSLPPGARGMVSVRVRFRWGLPLNYNDGTITILAGSNYNQAQLDVAEYNAYQARTITNRVAVSQADFTTLRGAHPDLQTLYSQSISEGYSYIDAARLTYSNGVETVNAVLRRNDRRYIRVLVQLEDTSMAVTTNGNEFMMQDTTGGMIMNLVTNQRSFWGTWASFSGSPTLAPDAFQAPACTSGFCLTNCLGKKITFGYIASRVGTFAAWVFLMPGAGVVGAVYEVGSTVVDVSECMKDCATDPGSNCCSGTTVRYTPSSYLGEPGCIREECNPTTGGYGIPGRIPCASYGQRCVAGYDSKGGCKNCTESSPSPVYTPISLDPCELGPSGVPRCKDLSLLRAKDPNAMYGPDGDLVPGQHVDYSITYENVGAGSAYGVYVSNILPEVFDESTLVINNGGFYLPATRELIWMVGELGPVGTPTSKGTITYSAHLKTGLPSGTVVRNQATVYFPSVPEETLTNSVVNVIQPLAATPQQLITPYMTPVSMTLTGVDVSGLPLTFSIVDLPVGGTLTGTLPSVTYNPAENFTGGDSFTFKASNGTSESRIAAVQIQVNSSVADTLAPQVLWTEPTSGAVDVTIQATPLYTDASGPVYIPFVVSGFSEALDASTVAVENVLFVDGKGKEVTFSLVNNSTSNQVLIIPRETLKAGTTYTITFKKSIKDLAGNGLASDFSWSFKTAGTSEVNVFLPLIMNNH